MELLPPPFKRSSLHNSFLGPILWRIETRQEEGEVKNQGCGEDTKGGRERREREEKGWESSI